MRKLAYILAIVLVLSSCGNVDWDQTNNQYSVFKKEYRTQETTRQDDILGTVHKVKKYTFDVPYDGHDKGYIYWCLETWNTDSVIEYVEYIHPFRYKQHEQIVTVIYDNGKVSPDTIISYGDSIWDNKEMYYYYGKVE